MCLLVYRTCTRVGWQRNLHGIMVANAKARDVRRSHPGPAPHVNRQRTKGRHQGGRVGGHHHRRTAGPGVPMARGQRRRLRRPRRHHVVHYRGQHRLGDGRHRPLCCSRIRQNISAILFCFCMSLVRQYLSSRVDIHQVRDSDQIQYVC